MTELLTIALGFLSYAFVILSIFRLFRINYFNPIVKIFTTYLEPLSKSIFFFLTPLLAAIGSALSLKFFSFYLANSSKFEPLTLFYSSIMDIVKFGFNILFISVMASVILSWVAPGSHHPLLQIIEEISNNILAPVRKFIPPMGGLDFSPMIGLYILYLIISTLT